MRIHVYLISAAINLLASVMGAATGFGSDLLVPLWQYFLVILGVIIIRFMTRRFTPEFKNLSSVFEISAVFSLSWEPILLICHIAQKMNFPLCDETYRAFDILVGFDGITIIEWISNYSTTCSIMTILYNMFFPAMFIALLAGGYFGSSHNVLERTAISIMLAFVIAAGLSSLFPAYGYGAFITTDLIKNVAIGATPVAQLDALRDGSMRMLNHIEGGGIITFPSMHWGLAVVLLCSTFRLRWLFIMILPMSLGFMITALVQGAHYLADAAAGALVGFLAVIISDRFLKLSIIDIIDNKISEFLCRDALSDNLGRPMQLS